MVLSIVFSSLLLMLSALALSPQGDKVNQSLMMELINKARQKGCQCGDTWYPPAAPVNWNDQLAKAAQVHVEDMGAKKYFSHDAPDGSDAGERISRQGYNWKTFGENIATGYESEEAAVQGWLKSPGHCRNIMSGRFKEVGVARQGRLWTQVFASR